MFRKTSSNVLLMTRFNKLQVEELQKSLSLKSQELEAKNALANQKLKQMVREGFIPITAALYQNIFYSALRM